MMKNAVNQKYNVNIWETIFREGFAKQNPE